MAAHRAQLGQIELQPDDEHQKHHAKLTQMTHTIGIVGQRKCVRANHHTDRQITQHRRQFEPAEQRHPQHGGQQIQQGQFKRAHV